MFDSLNKSVNIQVLVDVAVRIKIIYLVGSRSMPAVLIQPVHERTIVRMSSGLIVILCSNENRDETKINFY